MTLQEKALEIAITQLGIEEQPKGSNRGPDVEKYQKSVDIPPGSPWCMAFVYWNFNEACEAMGRQNQLLKNGHVLTCWRMRKDKFRVNGAPQPGDIGIMDFGKDLGHTFIVEKVENDVVHTIEGNSNDEGSREGYEVCRRTRPRSKIVGYLRFV